ncbi:MAG: glycosyltransferase family 39 protein [Bacteroidota bacterium]|nr:glycosyltransferase family 39 protein [Bacteroidota bacterium]
MSTQKNKPQAAKTAAKPSNTSNLLGRIEAYFGKKHVMYALIIVGVNVLFSFLMFDAKISIGGDDSSYIERANRFLHNGEFPFYQGPLYPLMLALPIAMFGINLWVLKFMSLIFSALGIWFLYKAFRGRIPYLVLFISLLFVSLNANIQFYSSQTYTEAFYMMLQAIGFIFAFKLIDKVLEGKPIKETWKLFLLNGSWVVFLSLCKPVALAMAAPIVAYFLLKKKWKAVLYMFLAILVARGALEVGLRATVGKPDSSQLEVILMKDQYKPQLGKEDFGGLMTRGKNNLGLYMAYHFYHIMHLNTNTLEKYYEKNKNENNMKLAWFTAAIFILITLLNWRKNQAIFFACLCFMAYLGATFFGIQANNMQERLILPAVPLMMLAFMGAFYQLASAVIFAQVYYVILIAVILFANLFFIGKQSSKNLPTLKQQLGGEKLAGFTPDWVNYLKMSEYCADSLPADAHILTRKGNMSYIYTNASDKFVSAYSPPTYGADSMLWWLKNQKITHINMASLRSNPDALDGKILTTMHSIMKPIDSVYPGRKFEMVKIYKTEGALSPEEEESAKLFKINYDK